MKINIIEYATLIMHLKLHGLDEKKSIEYEYKSAPLTILDKFTLSYLSVHEFFKQEKEKVLNELSKEKVMKKYDIKIAPVDIELNEVYIHKKEDKNIWALFQNILYKEEMINLESLIKQTMLLGSIDNVYLCDKRMQQNPKYESLFEGCSDRMLETIELKNYELTDIENIWRVLKEKKRIHAIIRFLLSTEPLSIMEEKFESTVPLVEDPFKKIEEEASRRKITPPESWLPYKES